ncbi:hypothetical protein AB205_0009420 [Aquarana catesbeiana]|uniref:Protein kinase domain-containing protein n=1 Tax=Aquarana catesbeiana TaxID=8400 RepID=A0A2G9R6A9_AQUCT|nr:hypothetical protein AB205_0009420 [Aquarana catesbeiana]
MFLQVLSDKPYYTVADYFSLGVIIYEMVTRTHPYSGYTRNAEILQRALLTFTPPFIRDITTPIKELLSGLLKVDPEKREFFVSNIRCLPFFNPINWTEVEKGKSPSPLAPDMLSKEPGHRRMEIAECLICTNKDKRMAKREQKKFEGFSYISESLKPQPMASSPAPAESH